MRRVGRVVVAFLAAVGALSLVVVVGGLVWLQTVGVPVRAGEPRKPVAGSTKVEKVSVDALLSFASLEARAGRELKLSHAGEGRIAVSTPVAVLGRKMDVRVVGELTPGGSSVSVKPSSVEVPGSSFVSGLVSAAARSAASVRIPLEGLPPGVSLTGVRVTDEGVQVHLEGSGVSVSR
ncbi:LmeA family phospholipid-binding protein [Austwickia chelonae]|uniref:LmeA family phospholipid-binding protein n=1 Tax=Austwickia chelonae TaxID=100225 RepID=UPI000E244B8C|nr:LmeA family phospholipid-binding protein [Austwickia chelonae]